MRSYILVSEFILIFLIWIDFSSSFVSVLVLKSSQQKLLTMLPTKEEKSRIQEAQAANPDLPLGSAEQFLLTLTSISELPARLKLWAFKLDFENSEKVSFNIIYVYILYIFVYFLINTQFNSKLFYIF